MDAALQRLVARIIDGHPDSFDRMSCYRSAVYLIEPTDLPIQFRIQLNNPAPIICQSHRAACAWDARVAGSISSLVAMARGSLDGDALFFSREITIEGDTNAMLAMRNALDAAEINLAWEIANLFGPFNPAARRAVQIGRPIMKHLLDIATASRGAGAA
jgi:predicted lipid carrier protein YhbT